MAVLLGLGLAQACYKGGEREKEAPPGLYGGLCLAPDGHCEEGQCNRSRNFCYDPSDPCDGFFCGGGERGTCVPDAQGLPACQCDPGFNNELFDLYCCPDSGLPFDDYCVAGSSNSG